MGKTKLTTKGFVATKGPISKTKTQPAQSITRKEDDTKDDTDDFDDKVTFCSDDELHERRLEVYAAQLKLKEFQNRKITDLNAKLYRINGRCYDREREDKHATDTSCEGLDAHIMLLIEELRSLCSKVKRDEDIDNCTCKFKCV